ncbi:MAG: hypothetical protein Q9216_004587 [Gyalolechia sp. 2 TL-2023]
MPPFRTVDIKSSYKSSNSGASDFPVDDWTSLNCYTNIKSSRFSSDSTSSRGSTTSYSSKSGSSGFGHRYAPYGYPAAGSTRSSYSSCSQINSHPQSVEAQLDYYTRTAPYKYKRHIARHTGIVHSPQILEHTCATPLPGQKTCTHASTTAGDIVNYIPTGSSEDVRGDRAGVPSKLSMHFMVLLPSYYKPVELQKKSAYHAALVISKNPVGSCTLLSPQPGHERLKSTNVPILRTVVFNAHSRRRSVVVDDEEEREWEWKPNTTVGYHIKIVHQDNLHAVIYPRHSTYGIRLADGAFQQVLQELGEEDDELENARYRDVEFWGKANGVRKYSKSSCKV